MKKVGKFCCCFLPILVGLLCQIVVSLGFSFAMGIYLGIKMVGLGISDAEEQAAYVAEAMSNGNVLLVITAIATLAVLIVGAVWYRAYRTATEFKLKEVVNIKLLAALGCLGVSLQLLISMCLNAVYPILPQTLTEQYSELIGSLMGGNIWLSLLATVILAPLAEELLFRGITMKMAQNIMPFLAANVLQAVLFGVYHLNWIQGAYAFVLGLILGFTARYFNSLWAAILLHAAVNGSAELLALIPESVTETIIGVAALAIVGVALLIVAAKLYPQAKKEPVSLEEVNEIDDFSKNSFDER